MEKAPELNNKMKILEAEFYHLPKVSIELKIPKNPMSGTLYLEGFIIKDDVGEEIGDFVLSNSKSLKNEHFASLNSININEKPKGEGYGKSTYLEIIKHLNGIKLKSGWQLSRGSFKIWEWLVSQGLAKKIKEGVTNENTENVAYSSSEYETI